MKAKAKVNSIVSFLSTKRSFCIPQGQIIVVCKNHDDLHWKPGDRDFCIPSDCDNPVSWVNESKIPHLNNPTFVTTRVTAAECATAAAIMLRHKLGHIPSLDCLEAITASALYTDVPFRLSELLVFSVEQNAVFKRSARSLQDQIAGESGKARSAWGTAEYERYFCSLFQKFTQYLFESASKNKWDSEPKYIEALNSKIFALQPQANLIHGIFCLDTSGFGWIDPRILPFFDQYHLAPIVVIKKQHRGDVQVPPGGVIYTIATRYNHALFRRLDLHYFYDRLSDLDSHRWTGSERIGGSSWAYPSTLTIDRVAAICAQVLSEVYQYTIS